MKNLNLINQCAGKARAAQCTAQVKPRTTRFSVGFKSLFTLFALLLTLGVGETGTL